MACVYGHIRKDTNEIFYIGIGKEIKRAYSKKYRNDHWNNIVNKSDYDVIIIKSDLSWDEACELEKYYIKHFNSNNRLYGYNITEGGDSPPKKQGKLSNSEIIEIRNYKIDCKNKSIPINFSFLENKFKIKKNLAKKILQNNLYKGIFPTENENKEVENNLKKCVLCLKYLPFNNFYNVKTKVGLSGRCIKCFRKKIKYRERKYIECNILFDIQKMYSYGSTLKDLSDLFNISQTSVKRLLFNN